MVSLCALIIKAVRLVYPPPPIYPNPQALFRSSRGIRHFLSVSRSILFFAALAFFLLAGDTRAQVACPQPSLPASPTERQVLLEFYCDTDGPNWTDNTNWDENDDPLTGVDNWYGVILDNNNRVITLALPDNNLSGPIPFELLVRLTNLRDLNLSVVS